MKRTGLKSRWVRLCSRLSGSSDPPGVCGLLFTGLDRRYRSQNRHYHTWEHIRSCLVHFDEFADSEVIEEPEALETAIWFHDAIYEPGAKDNEEKSASFLLTQGGDAGIASDLLERAAKLIRATDHIRSGGSAADDHDSATIGDIDLAILGAPRKRYERYRRAIRREYRFLDGNDFSRRRSEFLRSMLASKRIYSTDFFYNRYEEPARGNIAYELEHLAGKGQRTP